MTIGTGTVAVGGGVTIAYRTAGDAGAPPVVLLHGGGSKGAVSWDSCTTALAAAGLRAIALDLRGHGGSSRTRDYPLTGFRNDVLATMDALGLGAVSLVGHSLGAHTASLVARTAPERVTRLVLEDPPVPGATAGARSLPAWRLILPMLGLALHRGDFDRRALTEAIRQLREPDPDWWARLPSIVAPTLVIGGGPRSHIAAGGLDALVRALPDARLVTIPVGHRIHSTAPAAFEAAVLPFLTAGR